MLECHQIDNTAGVNAIAYRGQKPWHGLGQTMRGDETLEQWRTRAGLGWDAMKAPALFRTPVPPPEGEPPLIWDTHTIPDRFVLYRSDTKAALSTVSGRYQVVQPKDVLEFYRDLTARHGFELETAGALREGRVVWALAKTGNEITIAGNDVIGGYLLLSTSFDGSMSTTGRFTTVRVVCNNTLTAAHHSKPQVTVPHSTVFNMDAAKVKLGVGDAYVQFAEEARMMAERGVDTRTAIEFFMETYYSMKAEQMVDAQIRAKNNMDATIQRLASYFVQGPGSHLKSAEGTVWGLLNAVTYDIDHGGSGRARSPDNRLTAAWFGKGEQLKNKARELALEFATR